MVIRHETSAVAAYAARYDAMRAQVARLSAARAPADRWAPLAARYTLDPRRPLTPDQEAIAAELGPDDVLLDAGGAGRHGLPLALRCREVVNVEPSPGMRDAFLAGAEAAGIRNVRTVDADALEHGDLRGDVALVSDVTYFVRDIASFVGHLERAARRVHILLYAEPPPYRLGRAFIAVFGEEAEALPGHRELVPALWELGILPDVRVLPPEPLPEPPTREAAVTLVLRALTRLLDVDLQGDQAARAAVEARFEELFEPTAAGFRPAFFLGPERLLISWTARARHG